MAKLIGGGDNIYTICNHCGSCGMPECVRMDVRKVVLLTEVIQPVSDTVRIHQVSIIAGKNIAVLSPLISICDVCLANLAGAIYQKNLRRTCLQVLLSAQFDFVIKHTNSPNHFSIEI